MIARVEKLVEYEPHSFPTNEITEEVASKLHSQFSAQIDIEPPSFLNNHLWKLTPKGWVGYIPLEKDFHIYLAPKISIYNLFGMLEYAYRLDFKTLESISGAKSLCELYERLAVILAKRVLDRIRKGIYRSYLSEIDQLPFVRGKIDITEQLRYPGRTTLQCQYEDHTADIEDNQILLWTLYRIIESGLCTEAGQRYIHQAYRELNSYVSISRIPAALCVGRRYNRLNKDYELLHGLCRFFLEHTGPSHEPGENRMLPILVKMDDLFEMFVLEWLKKHMSESFEVRGQETVHFQMGTNISIDIDITIQDIRTGETVAVLDTKYKAPDRPDMSDVEQIVAYAEAKNCKRAILIYPVELPHEIKGFWGNDIFVQSLPFKIAHDLDQGGQEFLKRLGVA